MEALIAANPGVDPDRLQVGQVICLPPGICFARVLIFEASTWPVSARTGAPSM
ncbi:MAG: LysM peptidoglycan-binding domain-containing protein [Bacillota bacterium]